MDQRLLNILCCPVTKLPLQRLNKGQLEALNGAILADAVQTIAGDVVAGAFASGLISSDGKMIYRIEDNIPVMLPDQAISTVQLTNFPI